MKIANKNSLMVLVGASTFLAASSASAEVCGANGNSVVIIAGTVKPYISAIARALYNDPKPITIVYKGITSCLGIDAALNSTALTGTASYFDPGSSMPGNEVTCDLPSADAGATFADIGSSDVFAPTCGFAATGLPANIRDSFGPVQTMGFVVPAASTQKSISANAAYLIYGLGADIANIAPWTDPAFVYKRNEASGTSLLIGSGLSGKGLPARKWKNTDPMFSSAAVTALTTSSAPEKTMGVLAKTDITDTLSLSLRMLAYRDETQSCAYFPDSSENASDKQNVRDGHYKLWGPTHFYVKVDSTGNITNPNVARVMGIITGSSVPPAGLDLIRVDEVNNLVPTCAMKVQRTGEVGTAPMTPFSPPNSCSCYFDKLSTTKTSCTPCTSSGACPASAPVCSLQGFCEPT